jgi:hypothetical protein
MCRPRLDRVPSRLASFSPTNLQNRSDIFFLLSCEMFQVWCAAFYVPVISGVMAVLGELSF